MWVWRDEAALGARGDEGASVDVLRRARGSQPWTAEATARALTSVPSAWSDDIPEARSSGDGPDATPIFHALSADHTRRATLRAVPDSRGAQWSDGVPSPQEPQEPQESRWTSGRLAEVPTVPPPPSPGDEVISSPEDELRRRAERRRRPRSTPPDDAGGRHALRAVESSRGRHALR